MYSVQVEILYCNFFLFSPFIKTILYILGVGTIKKKLAAAAKPDIIISKNGDKWKIETKSTVQNLELNFKLDEEFDEVEGHGRKVKVRG